jgi:DNA invertase Pin-like site-specific DNA recombinase
VIETSDAIYSSISKRWEAAMVTKGKGCKMVGYRRTSTDDQRLGIEAQNTTLQRVAQERGCDLVKTFTEHESGGRNDRPELDRALKHARRVGAILVVAKLDRLARDSAFLMKLYDGDVPILFGDMPEIDGSAASRLMVQMMANIAEFERRRIGERTKEALQALKAKGVKLGAARDEAYKLTDEDRAKGSAKGGQTMRARAIDDMSDIAEIAMTMRANGATLKAVCEHLNAEGYTTRQGGQWSITQLVRLLDRLNDAE